MPKTRLFSLNFMFIRLRTSLRTFRKNDAVTLTTGSEMRNLKTNEEIEIAFKQFKTNKRKIGLQCPIRFGNISSVNTGEDGKTIDHSKPLDGPAGRRA